jgi:hypothetical protein
MKSILLLFVLCLLISACTGNQRYADSVLNRPLPANDSARNQECTWIRSEMARQQWFAGGAMATSPMQAAMYRAAAQQNIATLESRAANIGCRAAFSNGQ